jgi:ABC-type uncharacterized transport system permease subunit
MMETSMKKALSYAVIAMLLGTVIMLAPIMLIRHASLQDSGDGDVPKGLPTETYCPDERPRFMVTVTDRAEALGRTFCPPNLSFAALMLIPSFFLALGVSLCFKKRTF